MSSTNRTRFVIVGIGNAGIAVLDRLVQSHPGMKDLLVVNSDPESLASSLVTDRLTVPAGDPKEGFLAIEEEFGRVVAGASAVLLCGALGGETGTFLVPALAVRAKADGIPVMASIGMPFTFEGRARREDASGALAKLREICDAVAVIDNDRLSGGVPSTAAVGDAFAMADATLLSSLLAIRGMLSTSGPVRITRADMTSVLGAHSGITLFGFGEGFGGNRLHEALESALKSPLFQIPGKGLALREARTLLLLLSGPEDLSFAEVQAAVTEIERRAGEKCQIRVGVHATSPSGQHLEVYLMGGTAGAAKEPVPTPTPTRSGSVQKTEGAKPVAPSVNPATTVAKPSKKQITPTKQTQGILELDNYQRGRFDKSEPTIVAGEDLDVPTFLRKGVKIPLLHGLKP